MAFLQTHNGQPVGELTSCAGADHLHTYRRIHQSALHRGWVTLTFTSLLVILTAIADHVTLLTQAVLQHSVNSQQVDPKLARPFFVAISGKIKRVSYAYCAAAS